jgi:hypothetical protein
MAFMQELPFQEGRPLSPITEEGESHLELIEYSLRAMLSVKTRRRAVTGNTRSREASGTAGGPRSLGQRPSDLARALAESR